MNSMELINPEIRYKVCFTCEVFMGIYPSDPINIHELKLFEKYHRNHMVQTVNHHEIPVHYTYWKLETIQKPF